MEAQLFNYNEKIICLDSTGQFRNGMPIDLIEGKQYTVNSPTGNGITLIGHGQKRYAQDRFITCSVEMDLDDEIREGLNKRLLI